MPTPNRASPPSQPLPAPGRGATPYLPYLEGMRGVLALYVVLYHIRHLLDPGFSVNGPAGALIPGRGAYLFFGNSAVAVFIVISGLVLTIPVAGGGMLAGGIWKFMGRRARRLVPAYYAAIVLSLPIWLLRSHLQQTNLPLRYIVEVVVTHFLFLHDLLQSTVLSLNGPLWTIAVEWQIYIAFAILLLPLQRRVGLAAGIAVAFALGLIPTGLGALRHVDPYPLQTAHFWYFGLFALGSSAAWIAYGSERYAAVRDRAPWKTLCVLGIAGFLASIAPSYGAGEVPITPLPDVLLGVACASGFLAVARDQRAGRRSLFATVFASRPLVRLGTFSYSLYLIHEPFVWIVMLNAWSLPPVVRLWAGLGTLVFIVAAAYGFARLFEFPFLSARRRTNELNALAQPSAG